MTCAAKLERQISCIQGQSVRVSRVLVQLSRIVNTPDSGDATWCPVTMMVGIVEFNSEPSPSQPKSIQIHALAPHAPAQEAHLDENPSPERHQSTETSLASGNMASIHVCIGITKPTGGKRRGVARNGVVDKHASAPADSDVGEESDLMRSG
ncbi:hypothetical protein BD779DRAFT_1477785 [Infundibulicybe gibba]|nr:hypothetical protein BD779DRAFT_1477785 [Infundibulicybe gibba]